MATPSEVKAGLDEIASSIATQRSKVELAIQNASAASVSLAALATSYSDVIASINGYLGGDAFEDVSKAELAKMTSEFTALKGNADTIAAVVIA